MFYVRPMASYEESFVREIFAGCHPTWAALPPFWYFANPTLVALELSTGAPVGFTSFSMNVTENGRLGIILQDCCVLPRFREQGVGRALMARRLEIAKALGATYAGCAVSTEDKHRLQTIRGLGFREIAEVPGGYSLATPPTDAVVFLMDLE